ncbi:MAG: hypothetical protein SCK28_02825 [Bacillota bacterium]|nr:hypothetical protein [Bacillota bacterium]
MTPPAYPTLVRNTPGSSPNWASGPQNQPKAKVAVSILVGRFVSINGFTLIPPLGNIQTKIIS